MDNENDQPAESTPNNEATAAPRASVCYALIPYKPPDHFTAIEAATFDHGTHAERIAVLKAVCMRSLSVPASVVESKDTNHSSTSTDLEAWKRRWGMSDNGN